MKILELFAGTGSVGKVALDLNWVKVALDINGEDHIDIQQDILTWNYKEAYRQGYFDVIWASFPCETFSTTKVSNIGRPCAKYGNKTWTKELIEKDIVEIGLPLLRKSEEIIDYFQPKAYFLENPATGCAKLYLKHRPMYVFDYCCFEWEWGYRKRTAIWTNVENVESRLCVPKSCKATYFCKETGRYRHIRTTDGGNRKKGTVGTTRDERYRIPAELIRYLFSHINKTKNG
ncbi:cytosine DNA methyltransferase [European chub iridovirus]|nr:cytosine DNA methyltransferase [European chub iridovirus]